jgi:hypothetical protein
MMEKVKLREALYLLDGLNSYRVEVPIYTIEKWVKEGKITPFENEQSERMFRKLKRKYRVNQLQKGLGYDSLLNE